MKYYTASLQLREIHKEAQIRAIKGLKIGKIGFISTAGYEERPMAMISLTWASYIISKLTVADEETLDSSSAFRIFALVSEYTLSEYVFEVDYETINKSLAADGFCCDFARRNIVAFSI